ncbi:hypothetical protein ASG31_13410 [Chryseobacterium sp. Leaf404]|uniref:hypothetical protein n=1 Tax=unclassified Chryseobacterium TaxID=2593645 RepID=UPI0006F3F9C1|nr:MULTISPECIES: hypothetical protein [unclassified Chryseobacterium]KQT16503.1 hypothetical protein ASG31_13410 [Chryseobacterium sp. Leaf404]
MKKENSIGFYLFQNLLLIISTGYKIDDKKKFSAFQNGVNEFKDFVFLQDGIIDNDIAWVSQFENNTNILAQCNQHYKNAIFSLLQIFPSDHLFWEYLAAEEKLYYSYIIKEKFNNIRRPVLEISDFEEMSYNKHNLALVPIKGMDWLFEAKAGYDDIKKIFTCIFNGMQMMDDIDDFAKDQASGQWNLLHSNVKKIITDENLVNDENLNRFEERIFYASGLCEKYSLYALEQYNNALINSEKFDFPELKIWLTQIIEEVQESIKLVQKITQ